MILTKDNLLRYVREKKYVTPATVAEAFETTTMIASAALSELSKERLVSITFLKLASSPYYYDPKQREALVELGEKHFSGYDKEIFKKLKEQQVVNANALSIQEGLAVERIKDFANPLTIEHQGKEFKFWIWYLRDIDETKSQIMEVLNPKGEEPKREARREADSGRGKEGRETASEKKEDKAEERRLKLNEEGDQENKVEQFIEDYFRKNYLKIESKNKREKNLEYNTSLKLNNLTIYFDCLYYSKKPSESDVLRFYSSSMKPKIVFIENCPKKLFKLAEGLENLEVVNV